MSFKRRNVNRQQPSFYIYITYVSVLGKYWSCFAAGRRGSQLKKKKTRMTPISPISTRTEQATDQ